MSTGASATLVAVVTTAMAVSACTPRPRSSPDPVTACDTGTVATTGSPISARKSFGALIETSAPPAFTVTIVASPRSSIE